MFRLEQRFLSMLQHSKKNEKLQPNTFVDGIHVKISEQYKPPKKIILPVSCQNCTLGEVLYAEVSATIDFFKYLNFND